MARAWPFEDVPEGGARRGVRKPEDFVAAYGEGLEAVVVRIGNHDSQLVIVDADGAWDRWVYHSHEEAMAAGRALEIPVHDGSFPEDVRVRMNLRRRPAEEFERGAYPEQGAVGPVIPYPENRPRRVGTRAEDRAKGAPETSAS